MPGSLRADPQHSIVGVVRHWLTGTFAGRVLLLGAGAKLLVRIARLISDGVPHAFDTAADVTLLIGVLLLIRRLFLETRGAVLWRVRRKLTVSYIFIGFVPMLLIIVLFLTAGLILFYNVSQYVTARRIDVLVEQARFLAESAAIGLQGADDQHELRQRLERRQRGAEPTYPFVSYAIVPADRSCSGSAPQSSGPAVTTTIAAGGWRHTDAPAFIPDWIGCDSMAGLVTVTDAATEWGTRVEVPVHVAARAVAWPDGRNSRYAVVVDVPMSAALLTRMKQDTGIDYGAVTASNKESRIQEDTGIAYGITATNKECRGFPLPGREFEPDVVKRAEPVQRLSNPLKRPQDWVAFFRWIDWDSGNSCQAVISIRMTLQELYGRVADTPATVNVNAILLVILAVIGVLFLLIQITAFIVGLALARSITGSVHELFTGTERVRQGDFTHKIPITSRDQLGELAESFNSMTQSIADLLQQKAEKERMEQELRIARNIQMSLLPRAPVTLPGLAVTAHCEPAREVGGDYYDYMDIGHQRLGLLIADVAGKGTSAALYMAELKGLMLSLSQLHSSPRQLLINANGIISRHLDSKSFITITYAVVDVAQRTLTYARAGHCPLIYVPGAYAASRAAQILVPDGMVLGLQIDDSGQRFSHLLQEVTVPLGPGDVFLFYTDGLTEAMDRDGNCFGDARLAAIVQEHADAPFDELRDTIFREITAYAGPVAQQDDMTLLLLRVKEVEGD